MAEGVSSRIECWVCREHKVPYGTPRTKCHDSVTWEVGTIAKTVLRGDNKAHHVCADCRKKAVCN